MDEFERAGLEICERCGQVMALRPHIEEDRWGRPPVLCSSCSEHLGEPLAGQPDRSYQRP